MPRRTTRSACRSSSENRDASSRLLRCVALDCFPHSRVREAAAQDRGGRLLQLRVACFRILIEECLRGQDDAVQAEAALRGTFVDERLLNRMRALRRAETFEGDNLRVGDRTDG